MTIQIDNMGMVEISQLTHHPLNEELYPLELHKEDIDLLAEKLKEEEKATGCPNHTPLVICSKTGIIFSGNFRVRAARKNGQKKLRAVYCTKQYNPKEDRYIEIKFLEKFNVDGKRDEYNINVLIRRFNLQNKYFELSMGRPMNAQERNAFATNNRFDKTKFKNLLKVYEQDVNLFDKVVVGTITLNKALRKLGMVKPDKKYNPNRFNFFKCLDSNPLIVKNSLSKGFEMINQFKSIGDGIIFNDTMGWETNQITQPLSNIWMSAFVYGFNSVNKSDLECITPRNRQGYADIHFENLTNKFGPQFLSERIEIKVGNWNGSASQSVVYGGMGSVRVSPHEYIIAFHNQQLNKHLVIITTLDKDDWKTDGKDANATMSLSHWFNKYGNTNKYRVLVGDIFKGNKSIEVTWADLPKVEYKQAA